MADINYPHDYLPLPLQEGYAFRPVNPLLRTEMTSGRARQRRRYLSTPTQALVQWTFVTQQQAQIFEAWYSESINDGASWFFMKLQTPLGLQFYKCRFTEIYEGPVLIPPRYWHYSATLELWERPLLPPGWIEFPEFLTGSDIIDKALNREWPIA
ncbi:MAG TPA: hypothetical protein VJY31_16505 [Buttiauxella sp.]|nr:hypothetical protein [Buttiauxella sp.]